MKADQSRYRVSSIHPQIAAVPRVIKAQVEGCYIQLCKARQAGYGGQKEKEKTAFQIKSFKVTYNVSNVGF